MELPQTIEKVRETKLALPPSFKKKLVAVKNTFWIVLLTTFALIIAADLGKKHVWNVIDRLPHILAMLMALWGWQIEKMAGWHYIIKENDFIEKYSIKLIHFSLWQKMWEWHTPALSANCIEEVREERWQDLPALRIATASKYPWKRKTLFLVYAHDDEKQVRTQILPLLEKYRQQYRHE